MSAMFSVFHETDLVREVVHHVTGKANMIISPLTYFRNAASHMETTLILF